MRTALAVLVALLVSATAGAENADFDAHVLKLLEQRSPGAAIPYRAADQARRAGDPGKAAEGYRKALELVPDFPHALRRLCQAEAELGERGAALQHCRRAVAVERSADNLASLAMVLVNMGAGGDEDSVREAVHLAREAARVDRSSVAAQTVLCQVAILANEMTTLRDCVAQLERMAADDWMTHMFAASLAVAQERWADARAALERSRELGLPDEVYAEIAAPIVEHEHMAPWLLYLIIVGALLLALGVGYVAMRGRRATPAR